MIEFLSSVLLTCKPVFFGSVDGDGQTGFATSDRAKPLPPDHSIVLEGSMNHRSAGSGK